MNTESSLVIEAKMDEPRTENIKEELKCGICLQMLYEPVTLLCQHTYCTECISKVFSKKCPSCNTFFFCPPVKNPLLKNIINIMYPDEVERRVEQEKLVKLQQDEESKREEQKKEIETKVREEIWRNYTAVRHQFYPTGLVPATFTEEVEEELDVEYIDGGTRVNEPGANIFVKVTNYSKQIVHKIISTANKLLPLLITATSITVLMQMNKSHHQLNQAQINYYNTKARYLSTKSI